MVLTELNSNHSESPMKKARGEEEESIQVFVRVRPINSQEKNKHSYSILDCPGTREVVVKERSGSSVTKTFTFDRAFGPHSKQLDVYRVVVSPLLEKVMQGYNCTVFAYGQTGTGKTFTMEGERSDGALNWSQDPMAGIVPRALGQLFDELRRQNSEFTIRVSLLELYNEELYDLLAPVEGPKLKNLRMFEDPTKKNSVTISGLEEVIVHSKSEVYQIMEKGSERRKTASTLMNAASSRSHTVLTVIVHIKESTMEGEDLLKIGKLNLVDLAGSENIGRSGAVDKRAREAGNINQSLLTLGRVITALVERAPHIPYRESKLTRILKDSLGGTTKTSIIATVSPAHINVEETLSTLEYAHRAKNITNQPTVNQRLTKHVMMSAYTEEIERLRRDLVATREKTGVWVDQKNFDETEAKLISLQQELQQSSTHTKNLSDSLEKYQADLTAKEAEFTDLQEDHSAVKLILSETNEKLKHTENALRKTEQAKQEQEHLVEKHVLTERNLASEASTLLDTADEATLSLERLYNKLERKRAVEQTNLEAGRRLKKEIAEQLNDISDHIDDFRKDHASFCGAQRMKLEQFVDEKSDTINSFLGNMKEVYEHFKAVCSESVTLVQNQNQVVLAQQSDTRDITMAKCKESLEVLNKVVAKIVDVELVEVADKITCMQSNMDVFVKDLKNQMASQNNQVSQYVDYNLKQLAKYKKDIVHVHDQQFLSNSTISKLSQEQEAQAEAYTDLVHAKVNEIMDGVNVIVEETNKFKERSGQNFSSVNSEIQSAEDRLKTQQSKILKSMKVDKVEGEKVKSAHEKSISSIVALADNKKSAVAEFAQCGLVTLQDSCSALQKHVADDQEYVTQIENILGERQMKLKSDVGGFQAKFEHLQVDSTNSTSTIVSGCEEKTNELLAADTLFIKSTQDILQDHCVQIDEWSEGQRSSVYQQAGKVREFWDSTYLVDKPTGATPHRQAYTYPKTLSATSPHERIIGRFRAAHTTYNDDEDRENF